MSSEVAVRVIPFSGKVEDWRLWSAKFLAKAHVKGYREILLGVTKIPNLPAPAAAGSTTAPTPLTEEELKIRHLNEVAYSELVMSIGDTAAGQVAFELVDSAKTTLLPFGDVSIAWTRLGLKYEPKTATSRLILKKELML